jgi:outer membrane protein
MKNLSLVLNIVLLVAVAVLFYLHFSGGKTSTGTSASQDVKPSDFKIAYILTDSVLEKYDYLKAGRNSLEDKQKKLNDEYRNRAMGLQSEITAYQRTRGSLTLSQDQAMQEDLGKKQQNLQMYEQSLSQQLMGEEQKLMKDLYDRLTKYCKKYAEANGVQVILKYDQASDVLYGGKGLDITDEITAGLNEDYKTEKDPSAKSKADSTGK